MTYTVSQLKEKLIPVFEKSGIKKAVLFGSYGKGTADEKSDIDILIDSGLKGLRFLGLLDEMQDVTGKEIDLFDVTHIEPGSLIEKEIISTGITVYEK